MKTTYILFLVLIFISCTKKDRINHYLTKPVTQEELINNGFYKYSSTYVPDDEYKIENNTTSVIKFNMYSNVKPKKNDEDQLCPTQLWHFYREDSIKEKKNKDYLKNKLNDRIITYLFRNDTLIYKDIIVFSIDKSRKEIVDFTSLDKIISYYHGLKISINPQIKNKETGEIYSNRFTIDNYKTRFYTENNSYEMFVDYKGDNYHAVLDHLYTGTYCY